MKKFKKIFVLLIIVSIINLKIPLNPFGQERVTKRPPGFISSPEVNLPVEKESKMSSWTWLILGLLAVGGVAAAAGGGGGGGGGTTTSPTPTAGSVAVGW